MAVYGIGSGIKLNRKGVVRGAYSPTAPNALDMGALAGVYEKPGETGTDPAQIVIGPVATDLTIDSFLVVLRGRDNDDEAVVYGPISFTVPYVPGQAIYPLGNLNDVLGPLDGADTIEWVLAPIEDSETGAPKKGFQELDVIPDIPVEPDEDVTLTTAPAWASGTMTEGAAMRAVVPGEYTGDPVFGAYTYWTSTDASALVALTDITSLIVANILPNDIGGKYISFVENVTGTGIVGTLSTRSNTVLVADVVTVPPAILDEDEWVLGPNITTGAPTADGVQPQFVGISTTRTDYNGVQWTTAANGLTDAEITALDQWEDMTIGSIASGFQRWSFNPSISGGVDYSWFDRVSRPNDESRGNRFRVRLLKDGVAGPSDPVVKLIYPAIVSHEDWIQLVSRTSAQYTQHSVGGNGYQFFRSWGYSMYGDANTIIGGRDIGLTLATKDFAAVWYNPSDTGLLGGRSCQGIELDPYNANWVVGVWSPSFLRPQGTGDNIWKGSGGIYQSSDLAETWAQRYAVDYTAGSGETSSGSQPQARFNQHPIAFDPTTGPATAAGASQRTVYCFIRQVPKGLAPLEGFIVRSLNGGQTWHRTHADGWNGAEFPSATYSADQKIRFLKWTPNGFYIVFDEGIWHSDDNCQTWTRVTGMSAGDIEWFEYLPAVLAPRPDAHAAYMRVGIRNKGIQQSNNNSNSPTWSFIMGAASGSVYRVHTFATSPHDNRIIFAAGARQSGSLARERCQRTINGGTSWHIVKNNVLPGDTSGFTGEIFADHIEFIWHRTNPAKCFAARFQHLGLIENANTTRTTDNTQSNYVQSNWASVGCDEQEVLDISFDPDDDSKAMLVYTDRISGATDNDFNYTYWNNNEEDADDARGYLGLPSTTHLGKATGALILKNGAAEKYYGSIGNGQKQVPVTYTKVGTNPIDTAAARDTGTVYTKAVKAHRVPGHSNVGYMGRWRIELSSGGVTTFSDQSYEVFGCSANGTIYGCVSGTGNSRIYRKLYTEANSEWARWNADTNTISTANGGVHFRPVDSDYEITVDEKSNDRVVFWGNDGRCYKMSGASPTSATAILDLRTIWAGLTVLGYQGNSIALDPVNSGVAYATTVMFGLPTVYKITNIWVGTPTAVDITNNLPQGYARIHVHPRYGTPIVSELTCGTRIYPAHGKTATTDLFYAKIKQYLDESQG